MSRLFSPLTLRSLTLPNRIILAPMCQYLAQDGVPTDWHLIHLGRYCAAGLGLVLTEATAVSARARITPACLGIWSDEQEAAFTRIVKDIKAFGGNVPVGLQLAHAGRKASTARPWDGGAPLTGADAWPTEAPSARPHDAGWPVPEALDETGLKRIKAEFAAGAARAARAGFDVLQVHATHGYLLHQFLSPVANARTDAYGGSRGARMRFPLEVVEAVRAAWPTDRPLMVRMTGTDWLGADGWQIDDAVAFATELKGLGVDFVDVSSGGIAARAPIPYGPGFQVPLAAEVRRRTGLVTSTVGVITSAEQAEAILAGGHADLISLGRALLNDPFWAWRAADALGAEITIPNSYLRGRHLDAPVPRTVTPAGSAR